MKHLPFNHGWVPFGSNTVNERDYDHPGPSSETSLTLLCDCGKMKTVRIARFPMSREQIATYIERVYL